MEDNPSVVNDESGNNYGGIGTGGSMGQAQMQFLENLQKLALKMPPKPLSNDQYMPGIGQGIQVGASSSQTLGYQSLFAASNLIPFAMMDEVKRSAAEAEAKYYAQLKPYLDKPYLDKPLVDAKLKLSNPWAQPEFADKIHKITDTALDAYANKLGGNYMMAHIALSQDKAFNRTLEEAAQYAAAYEKVYTTVLDTVAKSADKQNYFVSDAELGAAKKFIYSQDHIKDFSIEELGKSVRDYQAKDSIFKLADADTKGVKESVRAFFEKNPDVNMSNTEEEVWVKNKITGENQADAIINTRIKSSSWLNDEPDQLELYKQEVKARIPYSIEQEIIKVKGENADRDQELRRYGVKTDEQGVIQFGTKPSALIGNIGINAINYPVDKNQPVPTVSGMQVYVRTDGTIKRVTLPASYSMIPTAEYDLVDEGMAVMRGRYIEGKVNFQGTEPYTPENERALTSQGKLVGTYSLGEGKASLQVVPVKATDDMGNVIELVGETTVLAPYETMRGQIEANIGLTDAIQYAHKKLETMTYPAGGRRNFDPMGNAIKEGSKVIVPPDDATLGFFKNDPNIYYNWGGQILSGEYIHKNAK
jgi:hypothetical protein